LLTSKKMVATNIDSGLEYVFVSLTYLGELYDEDEKTEKAIAIYTETIEIAKQLPKEKRDLYDKKLCNVLSSLGQLYEDAHQMTEAEAAYKEAIRIYRQMIDKNPDDFSTDFTFKLAAIGRFYLSMKKLNEAEKAFEEIVRIYEELTKETYGPFLYALANNLLDLGHIYKSNNKITDAAKVYAQSIKYLRDLVEHKSKSYSDFLAYSLVTTGSVYLISGKKAEGFTYINEGISIQENLILANQGTVKHWSRLVNTLLDVLKDTSNIKKDYEAIVKIRLLIAESADKIKNVDKKMLSVAIGSYNNLAWSALLAKDFSRSEKAALRCLELDKTKDEALMTLGHSQLLRGQYTAAKTTYEQLKGKKDNEGKNYKELILDDFKYFEAKGITHGDMPRMKAEIEKW
jgi:tetratricopeptide (TPR) repeat protein